MDILFIYRDKHFVNHNFESIFKKNLCKLDFGFLLLSLKTIANVKLYSLCDFLNSKKIITYDHVVIDSKIIIDYNEKNYIYLLKKKINTKVSIFLSYDRPTEYKDIFIFEKYLTVISYLLPNLLKNFDNYNIKNNIKDKFYETHYGLGFIEIPYDFSERNFLFKKKFNKFTTDIFYSGERTNGKLIRTNIIEDIFKEKSITNKNIIYYDKKDRNKSILPFNKYIEYTKCSRINLVLAGNANNITYRLYEVLFLKSFFLADPHLTNYKISDNFEHIKEIVFYDFSDFLSKVRYYLSDYKKIEKVAKINSEIFEKIYNPQNHGNFLKKIFFN